MKMVTVQVRVSGYDYWSPQEQFDFVLNELQDDPDMKQISDTEIEWGKRTIILVKDVKRYPKRK